MVRKLPDYVERRIVVEYGLRYVYAYVTDGNGKLIDEESFRQPILLERKECHDEAKETYDRVYDWLNETINFPTAGSDDEDATQDGEEE